MNQSKTTCCKKEAGENKSLLSGILLGILPHSFCLAFALFSIIGAVSASSFLKKFLLVQNFFLILVLVSLLLATLSSAIYLKRNDCLCASGIKNKWKYLFTLYFSTLLVNLLMFFIILPSLANADFQTKALSNSPSESSQAIFLTELSIQVQVPCSGHASLIIDEIKKNSAVQSVAFSLPNTFRIKYDPLKTTPEKILSLEIFKTFPATLKSSEKIF